MPKTYFVELFIEARSSVSVLAVGVKSGLSKTKGWFQRSISSGNVPQADGSTADVRRTMKRKGFGNWYSETVTNSETGAVIHQCDEPLDVHQGHGSDKQRPN